MPLRKGKMARNETLPGTRAVVGREHVLARLFHFTLLALNLGRRPTLQQARHARTLEIALT
jgi:hypothetical protein